MKNTGTLGGGELNILSESKKVPARTELIFKVILITMGLVGCGGCFFTLFDIPYSLWEIIFACAVTTAAGGFVFTKSKVLKVILFLMIGGLVFYVFRHSRELQRGGLAMINMVIYDINKEIGTQIASFTVSNVLVYDDIRLFMTFLFIPLAAIISVLVFNNTGFVLLLPLTLPFYAIGIVIGKAPAHWAFGLMIAFLGGCFASEASSFIMLGKKKTGSFSKSGSRNFYFLSDEKRLIPAKTAITAAAVIFGCFSAVCFVFDKIGYERDFDKPQYALSAESFIAETGSDIKKKIAIGSSGRVYLGKQDKLTYTYEVDVATRFYNTGKKMYLKNFVGGEYTGDGWKTFDKKEIKPYENTLKKVSERCGTPLNTAYYAYGQSGFFEKHLIAILVKNGQKGLVYAPYNADYTMAEDREDYYDFFSVVDEDNHYFELDYYPADYDYVWDNIKLFDEYPPLYYPDVWEGRYPTMPAGLSAEYDEYVHDIYTRLPEDRLEKVKSDFSHLNGKSYEEIITEVTEYLRKNTEYTLSPGQVPAGKDITEYFLYESKKGYCSYYATAAVTMLRAAGVPARYAEGYVIPSSLVAESDIGQPVRVDITDNMAHAWVEIYLDGVGWFPYDITMEAAESYVAEVPPEEKRPETTQQTESSESDSEASSESSRAEEESSAAESNAENSSSQQDGEVPHLPNESQSAVKFSINDAQRVAVRIIIIIAVILAVLEARRYLVVGKRGKQLGSGSYNERVIHCYGYLKALCEFDRTEKYKEYKALAEEAKFSEHVISGESFSGMLEYVKKYAEEIYRGCGPFKKVIFRLIKALR